MAELKTGVFGFGKTGRALLKHLHGEKNRHIYLVNDGVPEDGQALKMELERGVCFIDAALDWDKLRELDLLILSPGVDGRHERFRALRRQGTRIVSEIEYARSLIPGRVLAVTGSNGKSTTVSLIHHLLSFGGLKSHLLGNIGRPLISALPDIGPEDTVVLELSSFQLEEIENFRADIALLLNLTPDHLDRYPDFSAYAAAKAAIFSNQRSVDAAVLNYDDPWCRSHGEKLSSGRLFWFSRLEEVERGVSCRDDRAFLSLNGSRSELSLAGNPLNGVHNLENVLAAVLAAGLCGLKGDLLSAGLESFRGLAHRMEKVAELNGVVFINDSKATNVDAALKSIMSVNGRAAVILGGKDKGGDFRPLGQLLARPGFSVFLIGQAAPTIAAQLEGSGIRFNWAADLAEATRRAYESLLPQGGVVLLAPACASFDMFRNFEHRGQEFALIAGNLAGETDNG